MSKSIFTLIALAACAGGCTILSGANDLQVDDSANTTTAATDPDGGSPPKTDASSASNDASAPDAAMSADDAMAQVDASPTTPDSSAPTCDPNNAKLTSCASDGALSLSIVSCNDYCQSRGACCNPNACTFLGIPVAGTWSELSATCNISPDYEMTTCTEPIRGNVPGYFRCCCD